MILVDTSVWVGHLRNGSPQLEALLVEGEVMCHPLVIGELACGNLKNRSVILGLLQALTMGVLVEPAEVLNLLEERRLYGRGLGWIDVNLIASALLSGVRLWTADQPLNRVAAELGIRFQ